MKKKFRFGLLIVAMLLSSGTDFTQSTAQGEPWKSWMSGSKAKQDYESQLSMARLSERHGRADNAKKIYSAILEKMPQHQMAHHRMGVLFAMEGNFAKADQHFNLAMQSGTPSAELMGDFGYCLFLQERFQEAEQSLRQTIQRFPAHKAAHNSLGMLLAQNGRYDEALAEFRQVVGEAEAHANLAYIMSQTGHLEQASKHYHQALELDESLNQAAEALIQLNHHLPSQSAVFTRTPSGTSKRNVNASAPASPKGQNVSSRRSAGLDQMAVVDATEMKSDDPNNPIPQVAKPAIPHSPQIPAQVQTPFKFAGSAFKAPKATQPQSAGAPTAESLIASIEDEPASQVEMISPAQLSGKKPTYSMATETAVPATQASPRILESPYPQIVASDEEADVDAQATQLAAAKAQADLLMQASPLDQPQAYNTYASADPIGTSVDQSEAEYLPTAFITGPQTPTAPMMKPEKTTESVKEVLPPTQSAAAPAAWKIVLLTIGGMFGLVSVGGVFWYIGKRRSSAQQGSRWLSNVEEKPFDAEETYTYLENQIRDVWAGRSKQEHSQFIGGSATSYYR